MTLHTLRVSTLFVLFVVTGPAAPGQEINLKGTSVDFALGDLFASAAKGNQRKSEFDFLTLDVKKGLLKCDVTVANKHVVENPFGQKTTIWNSNVKRNLIFDLNAAPPTQGVNLGMEVTVAYVDIFKTLNVGRDWCLLTIESKPDKAIVMLDGKEWGPTRRDGFMQPGKYKIKVQKTGFEPVEADIEMKRGEATPLLYTLKEIKP